MSKLVFMYKYCKKIYSFLCVSKLFIIKSIKLYQIVPFSMLSFIKIYKYIRYVTSK